MSTSNPLMSRSTGGGEGGGGREGKELQRASSSMHADDGSETSATSNFLSVGGGAIKGFSGRAAEAAAATASAMKSAASSMAVRTGLSRADTRAQLIQEGKSGIVRKKPSGRPRSQRRIPSAPSIQSHNSNGRALPRVPKKP